jgi:hypothetical protein
VRQMPLNVSESLTASFWTMNTSLFSGQLGGIWRPITFNVILIITHVISNNLPSSGTKMISNYNVHSPSWIKLVVSQKELLIDISMGSHFYAFFCTDSHLGILIHTTTLLWIILWLLMYSLSVLIRGSPKTILCSSIGLGTVVVVVVCTACRTYLITQDIHCLSDRFYHTGQPVCLTDFITQDNHCLSDRFYHMEQPLPVWQILSHRTTTVCLTDFITHDNHCLSDRFYHTWQSLPV